jgi:hypothetical protein
MTPRQPSEGISIVGAVPPSLAQHFRVVSAPQLPVALRLPRPGERDPIYSTSRSWLIDTDASLPPEDRFLFRVRQRGKMRGTVFVNVAKLNAFMKNSEAADLKASDGEYSHSSGELVPA